MKQLKTYLRDLHELGTWFRYYKNTHSLYIRSKQKDAIESLSELKPYFDSGSLECWEVRSRDRWVTYVKEVEGEVLANAFYSWDDIYESLDITDVVDREHLTDGQEIEFWDTVARERYGEEGLKHYLEHGYFWTDESPWI